MTTMIDRSSTRRAETIRPIPFGTLFRVELGKATDTRAARWLMGLTAAATVLIMLAPLLARHSIDQDYLGYLDFAMVPVGTLLPVVAILAITSEWGQRTVLTTFTQEPRRNRVLSAKLAVAAVLAIGGAVLTAIVLAGALGIADRTGRPVDLHVGSAEVIGLVLYCLLNVLSGAGFGAALQNTPAAIVLSLLVPTAAGLLGAASTTVAHWIDPSTAFNWAARGEFDGHLGPMLTNTLLWIVAPLAIGAWRGVHREVK